MIIDYIMSENLIHDQFDHNIRRDQNLSACSD